MTGSPWRSAIAVCLALLCAMAPVGCFIVPKLESKEIARRPFQSDPEVTSQRLDVWAQRRGSVAHIGAAWRRTCEVQRGAEVDYRRDKVASLWTPSGGGGCGGRGCLILLAFVVVVAPITLALSGIVTWATIAGHKSNVVTRDEVLDPQSYACDAAAPNVQVRIVVGQQMYYARTDASGRARVNLGSTSPQDWHRGMIYLDGPPGGMQGQWPIAP